MARIYEQLRKVIKASGKSRYRISKDTGIDQSALSFFMSGKLGLSVERLELLAKYLGYRVILERKRGGK